MLLTKLSLCRIIHPKRLLDWWWSWFQLFLVQEIFLTCQTCHWGKSSESAIQLPTERRFTFCLLACRAVAQVGLISFANIASPSTTSYSPAPIMSPANTRFCFMNPPRENDLMFSCRAQNHVSPQSNPAPGFRQCQFKIYITLGTTYLCSLLCFKEMNF